MTTNSMTLDDLERPKRPSCRNRIVLVPACLVGVKAACVHLCWVAGNTVLFVFYSHVPFLASWLTFLINLSWVEYCVIPHGKWLPLALRWGSINSHTEPLTHSNTNHLEDVAYWHRAVRKPVNKDRLQQPLGIVQRPASTCHSATDRQTDRHLYV